MKKLIILFLFVSSLCMGQVKTYKIGAMEIHDSSGVSSWINRALKTTRSIITDTLFIGSERLILNDLARSHPDSVKWVSKKFAGDKEKYTFTTIRNAIDSSGAGCLIVIFPGIYNESVKLKNGVNLYLDDAIIQYSGQDSLSTISDSAGAVTCSIFGTGSIIRGFVDGIEFPPVGGSKFGAITLYHNSNVYVNVHAIGNKNNTDLDAVVANVMMYQGTLTVITHRMSTDEYDPASSSNTFYVYQQGGTLHLTVDSCYTTAGGRGNFYFTTSSQTVKVNRNMKNVRFNSNISANTDFTAHNIYGAIIIGNRAQTFVRANMLISEGASTITVNGGQMNVFVADSLRSRTRIFGDSCAALWATGSAVLNINAGVIKADSTYAMLLTDSCQGTITAKEISSKYGSAVKFSSVNALTIRSANIQSDSIGTTGFHTGTVMIGSNNLKLSNCQITTKQSGTAYSINSFSGASTFEILGTLQANKSVNAGICNLKGIFIKDGELVVGVCGADITSDGYTQLGELAPSMKFVLIKGTMPSTNTTKDYPHGFTGNNFKKFISITAQVRDDTAGAGNTKFWLPNTAYPTTHNYQVYADSLNCIADLTNGLGTKLFSDSVFFLITYIQ